MQKGHRLNRPSRVIPGTRGLALLVAAYCVFVSSAAEAQRAAPEQVPDSPSTQNYLEDIIVTARRRPEPLQRVPVSVVALSKEDLESRSVTNLRTLQNFVPNVTFAPSQNVGEAAANVFIRGIGQEDFGVGAEGGVAFYVDGVYLPRSLGLLMNLTDVDRVEVLRGPQGTLYGKDSIGGAINVISTMPGADRERRAEVILGNYQRVELRTILNEPLSRRLFLRAALGLVNRDWLSSPPRSAGSHCARRGRERPIDRSSLGRGRSRPGRPAAAALADQRYAHRGRVTGRIAQARPPGSDPHRPDRSEIRATLASSTR